jgi:hypothetical protein
MTLLNEAVWQSVKGAGSPMPAPQHHVIDPAAYTGKGDLGTHHWPFGI